MATFARKNRSGLKDVVFQRNTEKCTIQLAKTKNAFLIKKRLVTPRSTLLLTSTTTNPTIPAIPELTSTTSDNTNSLNDSQLHHLLELGQMRVQPKLIVEIKYRSDTLKPLNLIEYNKPQNQDNHYHDDSDNIDNIDNSNNSEMNMLWNLILKFFQVETIQEKYAALKTIRQIITRDDGDDYEQHGYHEHNSIGRLRLLQQIIQYPIPLFKVNAIETKNFDRSQSQSQSQLQPYLFLQMMINGLKHNLHVRNNLNGYIEPIQYYMIDEALWILSTFTERRDHVEIILKFDILGMLTHYIFWDQEETSNQAVRIINNLLNSSLNQKIADSILFHFQDNNYFTRLVSRCQEYKNSDSTELLVAMFTYLFNQENYDYNYGYGYQIDQSNQSDQTDQAEQNDQTEQKESDQHNSNNNNTQHTNKSKSKSDSELEAESEEKEMKMEVYLDKLVPFLRHILLKEGRNPNNNIIAKYILEFFRNITHNMNSITIKKFLLNTPFINFIIDLYLPDKLPIATEAIYIVKNIMSTQDNDLIDHVIENKGLIIMSNLLNKHKHRHPLSNDRMDGKDIKINGNGNELTLSSTRNNNFETLLVGTLKYSSYQLHQAQKVFKCQFNLVQNMIDLLSDHSLSSLESKKDVVHFIYLIVQHKNERWDGQLIRSGVLKGLINLLEFKQHWDIHVLLNIMICVKELLSRFIDNEENPWYSEFIEIGGWEVIERYQNCSNDEIDYYVEEILQKVRMKLECSSDSDDDSRENKNRKDNDDIFKFYDTENINININNDDLNSNKLNWNIKQGSNTLNFNVNNYDPINVNKNDNTTNTGITKLFTSSIANASANTKCSFPFNF